MGIKRYVEFQLKKAKEYAEEHRLWMVEGAEQAAFGAIEYFTLYATETDSKIVAEIEKWWDEEIRPQFLEAIRNSIE